jgi:hypothetical protein
MAFTPQVMHYFYAPNKIDAVISFLCKIIAVCMVFTANTNFFERFKLNCYKCAPSVFICSDTMHTYKVERIAPDSLISLI